MLDMTLLQYCQYSSEEPCRFEDYANDDHVIKVNRCNETTSKSCPSILHEYLRSFLWPSRVLRQQRIHHPLMTAAVNNCPFFGLSGFFVLSGKDDKPRKHSSYAPSQIRLQAPTVSANLPDESSLGKNYLFKFPKVENFANLVKCVISKGRNVSS